MFAAVVAICEPPCLTIYPVAPPEVLWQLAIYENDDGFVQRRQALANPAFAHAYEVVTTWREDASSAPAPPEERKGSEGGQA